ncbi:MAG: hypothetical protein PHE29_14600 [Tissierellia bacterium]|nr:hypothetical protein [Tissierellia bacterium]
MHIIWTREDVAVEINKRNKKYKSPIREFKNKIKNNPKQKKLIEDYKGKDGYRRYLHSDWWRERKIDYWAKHYRACYCCGYYATSLHHNNYSRLNEEKDKDLVPVCDDCHNEIHRMINRGEAKLKNAHKILKSKR